MVGIADLIKIEPVQLTITGVRTKKICCQDILTQKGVNIDGILPKYETSKLVDLIKQGLTAVAAKDLYEKVKKVEEELKSKKALSDIETLLKEQGIQLPPPPNIPTLPNLISPEEKVIPLTPPNAMPLPSPFYGYEPYLYGGQQTYEDISSKLSTFIRSLSEFNKNIKSELYNLLKEIKVENTTSQLQHKEIIEVIYTTSKAMTKELADYFRTMLADMMKHSCAYFPVGINGALSLRVKNNTPMPLVAHIDNIVVKSGEYELCKPQSMDIIAAPMEEDIINVPINVENIDAVEYLVNSKDKGVIPVEVIARVKIGGTTQNIRLVNGNVGVR